MDIKPKFTIERLSQMDLNNPKEVSIKDIFESIKYYDDTFNTVTLFEDSSTSKHIFISLKKVYQVPEKLNKLEWTDSYIKVTLKDFQYHFEEFCTYPRLQALRNFYKKHMEKQKNKIAILNMHSERDSHSTPLEIYIKEQLEPLDIEKFSTEEIFGFLDLFKLLLYNSIVMELPLVDDNISKVNSRLKNNIKSLSPILKRMGEFELVKTLQKVEEKKVHTYTSFYKKWELENIKELESEYSSSMSKKILLLIKKIVREELETIDRIFDNEFNISIKDISELYPETIGILKLTKYRKIIP